MADEKKGNREFSTYFSSLDNVSQDRYKSKLMVDGVRLPDPYSKSLKGWSESVKCWPSVPYGEIYSYLINRPGQYTPESMKDMKSLDGYNYFISGHVQTCLCNTLEKDTTVCFVKAKVSPFQRANDEPPEPWVCLNKKQGHVVDAHCTCEAGLEEACSHIAALLFKVEAVGRFGLNQESKTSVACARKQVTAQRIVDIDFTKPKYGKTAKCKVGKQRRVEVAGLDESEQHRALEALRRISPTAGCLTEAESVTDNASEDKDLPPLLSRFRDTETKECSADDLQPPCAGFPKDFMVSRDQCDDLEKMTRTQSQSLLWQRHREGRTTATTARAFSTLQDTTSRERLVNRATNRSHIDLSSVGAVAPGRKYEDQAKQLYSEWTRADQFPCDVTSRHESDFYRGLDSVARQRYEEKISAVGADPYLIPPTEQKAARHCSTQELPALAYPDIFMFLIQVPGYSAAALKAYKNLEAYRYFLRGWVRSVMLCTQRDKFIITSQVISPEGIDENPHHVWAIIEPNGLVVSAHCTCIVGLEAACSHVAATLFALDAVVRIQQETPSPPLPASPRSGEAVRHVNFLHPNKRRKTTDEDSGHSKPAIPPPAAEELKRFYDSLARSGAKSVILSVLPGYCQEFNSST